MHAGDGTYNMPGFTVHASVCRCSILAVIMHISVGSYIVPGDITYASLSSCSILGVIMRAFTSMWSVIRKIVFSEDM